MTSAAIGERKPRFLKYLVIAAIILGIGYKVYADNYSNSNSFSKGKVTFTSQNLEMNVKIAKTKAERNQGLMNVKEMPKNEGMLFIFEAERRQGFWMKDTHIPLDMIFIGSDLKVRNIHEGAIPMDETPIASILPVKYVVEVNAGFVRDNQIKIGDRIQIKE